MGLVDLILPTVLLGGVVLAVATLWAWRGTRARPSEEERASGESIGGTTPEVGPGTPAVVAPPGGRGEEGVSSAGKQEPSESGQSTDDHPPMTPLPVDKDGSSSIGAAQSGRVNSPDISPTPHSGHQPTRSGSLLAEKERIHPMSPWNHQALASLRADLKLRVLMETGLGDKLEKAAGGFMDEHEAERVRQERTNMEQMDKLIQLLLGKSNEDFATFLKMLQDTNNGTWAHQLVERAKQFSQRQAGGEHASTLLEAGQSGCGAATRVGFEAELRSEGEVPAGTTQDKSLRAKLGCYYNKACIQDNPLLASSTMQYVKLNLVQPEQRRPVEGRVGEAMAVVYMILIAVASVLQVAAGGLAVNQYANLRGTVGSELTASMASFQPHTDFQTAYN